MLKKEKKRAAAAMKYAGSNYSENEQTVPNGHHSSGKKLYPNPIFSETTNTKVVLILFLISLFSRCIFKQWVTVIPGIPQVKVKVMVKVMVAGPAVGVREAVGGDIHLKQRKWKKRPKQKYVSAYFYLICTPKTFFESMPVSSTMICKCFFSTERMWDDPYCLYWDKRLQKAAKQNIM